MLHMKILKKMMSVWNAEIVMGWFCTSFVQLSYFILRMYKFVFFSGLTHVQP